VIEVTHEGLVLVEQNPDFTLEEIQAATGAPMIISAALKQMV
jgi:acetate CoA/acetoacetate CoA-transferase beta subunit